MKQIAMLVDTSNIYFTAMKKYKSTINYAKLVAFFSDLGEFKTLVAHGLKAPGYENFEKKLQSFGFDTRFKDFVKEHCTKDLVESLKDFSADLYIIGTSDPAILPVLNELKQIAKVVVVGCGIPKELRTFDFVEIPASLVEVRNAKSKGSNKE